MTDSASDHSLGPPLVQASHGVEEICARVAHDLNNWIAVILGHAGVALLRAPEDHQRDLLAIETAAHEAGDLIRQVQRLVDPEASEACHVDASTMVRDIAALLAVAAGPSAETRFDLASDLPPVFAPPRLLHLLTWSLVSDAARDLWPSEGTVTVRTHAGIGGGAALEVAGEPAGIRERRVADVQHAELSVPRPGDAEDRPVLASGSLVDQILEQSGADCHVERVPGGRSNVSVRFPPTSPA